MTQNIRYSKRAGTMLDNSMPESSSFLFLTGDWRELKNEGTWMKTCTNKQAHVADSVRSLSIFYIDMSIYTVKCTQVREI
jgi:hypothetical protein